MATPQKQFEKQLNRILKRLESKKYLDAIGKAAVESVVERTQDRGRGVREPEGQERKLKRLAQLTRERRKRSKNLSSKTLFWRSNLTHTGQMLESIYYRVIGRSKIQIRLRGKKSQNKAQAVSKARPFMNLSKKQVRNLLTLYNNLVRKVLK